MRLGTSTLANRAASWLVNMRPDAADWNPVGQSRTQAWPAFISPAVHRVLLPSIHFWSAAAPCAYPNMKERCNYLQDYFAGYYSRPSPLSGVPFNWASEVDLLEVMLLLWR